MESVYLMEVREEMRREEKRKREREREVRGI